MYFTSPLLLAALTALVPALAAATPVAPIGRDSLDTCFGETPNAQLDVPEWGQVWSLDKNDVDFYEIWGHDSRRFMFNPEQERPYTTEVFVFNVYEPKGQWLGKATQDLTVKESYTCRITALHGMQGQCVGVMLNTQGQTISSGQSTPVLTECIKCDQAPCPKPMMPTQ